MEGEGRILGQDLEGAGRGRQLGAAGGDQRGKHNLAAIVGPELLPAERDDDSLLGHEQATIDGVGRVAKAIGGRDAKAIRSWRYEATCLILAVPFEADLL